MQEKPTFTHLILSGGSGKGILYIGALRYLQQENHYKTIKYIYGTSIGSIFATFFGLNISMGDIENEFKNYFDELKCSELNILSFLKDYGIIKTEDNSLLLIVKKILKKYNYENYTFVDFAKRTGIQLNIKSVHYETFKTFTFNVDNSPNVLLIDAIGASTALPILFKPYKIGNELYIDGGLTENIPITIEYNINSNNILILISLTEENNAKIVDNSTIFNYIINMMNILTMNMNIRLLLQKKYKYFICFENYPIGFFPYKISEDGKINCTVTKQQIEDSVIAGYEQIYEKLKI